MKNENPKSLIKLYKGGIILSICEMDMKTFYPTNFLMNKFCPKKDSDGKYYFTLKKLNEIKNDKKLLNEPVDYEKIKLLIETLIGNLNNKDFCFYDPNIHESILLECKEIMKKVIHLLKNYEDEGILKLIRVHTDGIYIKVKKDICLKRILPELNDYLKKNWGYLYELKFKGHHQRGLFKNVNNFFLWTDNIKPIAKGVFFKEYQELTSALIKGYYNTNTGIAKDYSEYEKIKEELLKNPTKNYTQY